MHLEDAIAFVPYGTMVDEFQHIVYGNPDMTPKERRDAWKQLEKEYWPHLDITGCGFMEKGAYWQRQHHIFELPFYYIDYVLAQLCAFQFKIKMDKDHGAAWAALRRAQPARRRFSQNRHHLQRFYKPQGLPQHFQAPLP